MSAPMVLGSSRGPQIVKGADVVDAPGWAAPTVSLTGSAVSAQLSAPEFPLWLVRGTLQPGTSLTWNLPHGDEILYVTSGEVEVDGRVCPPGGAIVVESGVAATVVARGEAEVLHYGPVDPVPPTAFGAPDPDGHGVHVVGPGGTYAQVEHPRDTRYFADSTCPTCRATLLHTGRACRYESAAHSHSTDEIIHVISGEVAMGAYRLEVGDTLCIAKDVRYRFTSDGFAFLNYRSDGSYQSIGRDDPPILEGGAVHNFTPVMDLR
jgi:quercetin dioxygenase-like cupin family protein